MHFISYHLNVILYNWIQIWFKFECIFLVQIWLKLFKVLTTKTMLNVNKWSYWEQKTFVKHVDFLIIGAGIVGYSTAFSLRKRFPGAHILILERGILPSGASSKNAGFACFGSATELYDDLQNNPESVVWDTVAMRWRGLQHLQQLIGSKAIDLQVNGSWDLVTHRQEELYNRTREQLDYYNAQLKSITGEDEVYSIDRSVSRKFGFHGVQSSFYNRLEGQIDTAMMNHCFYKKVIADGIHVLFGVEVTCLEEPEAITNIGTFKAEKIAICTNGLTRQLLPDEDVAPARAQVLITKPINDLSLKGTFHYERGYYYFRNIDHRVLLGGGRHLDFAGEHSSAFENTPPIMQSLYQLLNEIILPGTPYEIEHEWAGIMGVGKSKKPIIKEVRKNVYCGIRLGGMGIAIGTLAGQELSEMMIR